MIALTLLTAGAGSFAIRSAQESAENQHRLKCLAAYMAFIQVIGGPEGEGIDRLKACERAINGQEPVHLDPREHPFVVERYEHCLAAHLLIAADLDQSLAEQRQSCR